MTVWRWLGSMIFVAGLLIFVGANVSVTAQDKKDEAPKTDAPKTDAPKTEAPKTEAPKTAAPKTEAPKTEAPKTETKTEAPKTDKAPEKKDDKTAAPNEPGKERLEWKAFEPKKVFYQELVTNTVQDMDVMSQKVSQKQSQTFILKWTAEEKNKDGDYVVTQEIVGLKMNINIGGNTIPYDSTDKNQPANPMTDFFKALLGLKLKLTISPKMEVKGIEGQEEFVKKLANTNPQMETLLKNILSKDALQQMAEPTWGALPDKGVAKGDTWTKPSVLKLGPIGTYSTKFTYTYEGVDEKTKLDRIKIKSELTYTKPEDKTGLPFVIKDATLASTSGSGYALFDRTKGRFTESSMQMELKGDLTIEVAAQETKVTLTQTQDAKSTTSDEEPAFLKTKDTKK